MNLNPFQKWAILLAELVALIFLLLPESLFHSFSCELQNLPQSYRSSNGYFIDNQVIVVGSREDVDAVIGTPTPVAPVTPGTPGTPGTPSTPGTVETVVGATTPIVSGTLSVTGTPAPSETPIVSPPAESERVILNLIEGCDLSYLDSRKALDSNATRAPRKLVMRLYEIPKGTTVGSVIGQIDARAQNREVFADPNYLTRLADLPNDPCALPGDPGGNGGRPFGGPGTLTLDPKAYDPLQAEVTFKKQWAFGSDGINLIDWENSTSSTRLTGRGVRVGVFDTSPYRISFPFIKRIGDAFPSPLWFTNWDAGGTTMVSNHGLFVANLIHRIAPNSRIQLIRVLYEDGCGELWTLNKGLEAYKSYMSAWTGKLNKTVINMSLGIRVPGEDPGGTTPEGNEASEILTALFNEELETLRSLIDEANTMGAILVASAGNDSTKIRDVSSGSIVEQIAEMQIPASDPNVIGVAAANQDGGLSCYSSKGDLAAPGGEGGVDPDDPSNNFCVPRAFSWDRMPNPCSESDLANCEYGLLSLAQTRYGRRYVLWSGTSFAAPLVSGMAALGYETMGKKRVVCLLQNGPSAGTDPVLGTGLINLNNLTDTTFVPLCP